MKHDTRKEIVLRFEELRGKPVVRRLATNSELLLFEYAGTIYASNLFFLHDSRGLPVDYMADLFRERGWVPCLQQFRMDAIRAGWSREKIDREVKAASGPSPGNGNPTAYPTETASAFAGDPPTAGSVHAYIHS